MTDLPHGADFSNQITFSSSMYCAVHGIMIWNSVITFQLVIMIISCYLDVVIWQMFYFKMNCVNCANVLPKDTNMWTRGASDLTTNPADGGQPTLPPDPQPHPNN